MNKQAIILFAVLIFTASGAFAQNIIGTYERVKDFMGAPSVLLIKNDGTFELSTGGTSIRGIYNVIDSKIIFTDKTGDYADTLAGEGSYVVLKHGEILDFKTLKDKAIQRHDVLTSSKWKLMK